MELQKKRGTAARFDFTRPGLFNPATFAKA
jgi:hypothetical protein